MRPRGWVPCEARGHGHATSSDIARYMLTGGNVRVIGVRMVRRLHGLSQDPCGEQDRIVQQALRILIEPIFERDFSAQSYGFRPGRSAQAAVARVEEQLEAGKTWVVDADIKGYFDNIGAEGGITTGIPMPGSLSGSWSSCPRSLTT